MMTLDDFARQVLRPAMTAVLIAQADATPLRYRTVVLTFKEWVRRVMDTGNHDHATAHRMVRGALASHRLTVDPR